MSSPSAWAPAGGTFPDDGLYPYPDAGPLGDSGVTTPWGWEIDGVPLTTMAYNITTSGGDLKAPPKFRGGNQRVPSRAGSLWVPKVADERTIQFDMWVIGAALDGTPLDRTALEQNWAFLRSLFWRLDGREFELAKYVLGPDNLPHRVVGRASYEDGLDPEMQGQTRATFQPTVRMTDPYFYEATRRDVVVPAFTGSVSLFPVDDTHPDGVLGWGGDLPTDDVRISWKGRAQVRAIAYRNSEPPVDAVDTPPSTTVFRYLPGVTNPSPSDDYSTMNDNTTYLLDAKERRATATRIDGVTSLDTGSWQRTSNPPRLDWLLVDDQPSVIRLTQTVPSGSGVPITISVRNRYL